MDKKGAEHRNEAWTRAGRSEQCEGGEIHVHRGLPSGRAGVQGGRGGAVGARTTGPRRGWECALRATPIWSCGRMGWSRASSTT